MTKTQSLWLLYNEGCSISEISEGLGIPPNRVRWLLKEGGVQLPKRKPGHVPKTMSSPWTNN